jgi:hypothetical protein
LHNDVTLSIFMSVYDFESTWEAKKNTIETPNDAKSLTIYQADETAMEKSMYAGVIGTGNHSFVDSLVERQCLASTQKLVGQRFQALLVAEQIEREVGESCHIMAWRFPHWESKELISWRSHRQVEDKVSSWNASGHTQIS